MAISKRLISFKPFYFEEHYNLITKEQMNTYMNRYSPTTKRKVIIMLELKQSDNEEIKGKR